MKTFFISGWKRGLLATVPLFLFVSLQAQMPLHQSLRDRAMRGEIRLETREEAKALKGRGIDAPWSDPRLLEQKALNPQSTPRSFGPLSPPSGQWKALAILVDFTDNVAAVTPSFFDNLLFGAPPSASVRDYFRKVSYGNLDIITVSLPSTVGWRRAPQTYSYYVNGQRGFGMYPRNAQKLTEDAVAAADPFVDFSQYDNDHDGLVDLLLIVHSGQGYEMSGNVNHIHSHAWRTNGPKAVDGVSVLRYSMEPELWFTPGDMTIGVYVHEVGHAAFGCPDLYDYDYDSRGLGDWSLMAGGSWNGTNGSSPAHPDAFSRMQMGYLTPVSVTNNLYGVPIQAVENASVGYRLWTNGTMGTQYFLVENRQQVGYDAALPASGLHIYHVDETAFNNDYQWYPGYTTHGNYRVALEQADGLWELERDIDGGDTGDPFPGSTNNGTFDVSTLPDSRSYSFATTNVAVRNISNSALTMFADLFVKPASIVNGDFEAGLNAWQGGGCVVPAIVQPGCNSASVAKVNITGKNCNAQFFQHGFAIERGKRYRVKFQAWSSRGEDMQLTVLPHNASTPNIGLDRRVDLGTNVCGNYQFDFLATGSTSDARLRFFFNFMSTTGYWYMFDNVSIERLFPKEGESEELAVPTAYALGQNYPNPFNPTTNISFSIPKDGNVSLKVFDLLGREVASLVNEVRVAGSYSETFDASRLSSGTYFYRLESGSSVKTKKMLILR